MWKFCITNLGYLLPIFVLSGNTDYNKSKKDDSKNILQNKRLLQSKIHY